jgi:hypothetical protein
MKPEATAGGLAVAAGGTVEHVDRGTAASRQTRARARSDGAGVPLHAGMRPRSRPPRAHGLRPGPGTCCRHALKPTGAYGNSDTRCGRADSQVRAAAPEGADRGSRPAGESF